MPDKEDDRTRHILTQSAHAEPVMMTYRDDKSIDKLVAEVQKNHDPIFDFTAEDDVRHTVLESRPYHRIL
ncbi:MAG: DUF1015 family protein [Balneolaceae bacterium]|nr:DUF1015 family protein [Balneolaceae bacterium]